MREPHLDALSVVPRLLEGFGAGKRAGDVAGTFVDAARHPAKRGIGTASGFERTRGTIPRASEVEERGPVVHDSSTRRQGLPRRTGISVGTFVVAEVLTREGSVIPLGLVPETANAFFISSFDR